MKLKQSVLIMMAAALPVVSFAASEIPVTKQDTVNVQANQTNAKRVNRNDLTYRISSTATPEQNRALRSKASKVDRNAVEVRTVIWIVKRLLYHLWNLLQIIWI